MVAPTSCFAQVLSLVDRREFERAAVECEAEKGAKGQCRTMMNNVRQVLGHARMLDAPLSPPTSATLRAAEVFLVAAAMRSSQF